MLLATGCSLLGGGGTRERGTIYAPDPRVDADPSWPTVQWQLAISPATAARMTDSLRIAVRPTPDELQVYKGANWSRPPTLMLADAVLRALEDSGHIGAVARQGSGIAGDYRSEEHTSELQSLMRISYAVFCLKKKKENNNDSYT